MALLGSCCTLQLAAASALLAAALVQLRRLLKLQADLQRAEEEARFAAEERKAERTGRVKAERELRELQLRLAQLQSSAGAGGSGAPPQLDGGAPVDWQSLAFPLRPIGVLRSCFSRRNGTPRQPLLVPAARARLALRPGLSPDCLEGLQQYSHAWVLYIFHENTNLQQLWAPPGDKGAQGGGVRAKIRVPRLDGGRMGVLATRSPHRPCPIGLSVARVVSVQGRVLTLAGADIVDGSPVLDIKPFVPFCDNVTTAAAPPWVAAEAEQEPLHIGALRVLPAAEAAMEQCWRALGQRSLYASFAEYRELVEQVLARDIRSVTQRVKVPQREQRGGPAALSASGTAAAASAAGARAAAAAGGPAAAAGDGAAGAEAAGEAAAEGFWKVVLDGIKLSYDVEEGSNDVVLRSAELA